MGTASRLRRVECALTVVKGRKGDERREKGFFALYEGL